MGQLRRELYFMYAFVKETGGQAGKAGVVRRGHAPCHCWEM